MKTLAGKTAFVTGAASGIGLGIATALAQAGVKVMLCDIEEDALAKAVEGLRRTNADVDSVRADVSLKAELEAAAKETIARYGKVHILVNNAGITGGNGALWELDPAAWKRVIEVNLIGPYLTCRAVVPLMLQQGYGRIVNIASVAGKEGNPNASHYSASKAGLIALTKSLAKELATRGILVNCVTPAAAKTELFTQMTPQHVEYMLSKIPMNRFVEPSEIAALSCWLASEECSFSTGGVFDISGGRATY